MSQWWRTGRRFGRLFAFAYWGLLLKSSFCRYVVLKSFHNFVDGKTFLYLLYYIIFQIKMSMTKQRISAIFIVAALISMPTMTVQTVAAAKRLTILTSAKADSAYLSDCSDSSPKGNFAGGIDIRLFPKLTKQTFYGFGTSMSDGNACAAMQLSKSQRREAVRRLFSRNDGNGYTFCRVPMGSNDFSTCDYTCIEEGDTTFKTFNIKQDKKYIIPMLRLAQEFSPSLRLMISPWSPPAFMKENGKRINAGRLLPKYRDLWAEHYARFIKAYAEEGFTTGLLTIQNEAFAWQTWESCFYSGEDEGKFAAGFLRRHLDNNGLQNVRILFLDHNRNRLLERSAATFAQAGAREAIDGVGHHWYEGDHFEQLDAFHQLYPEKLMVESEFCTGPNKGRTSMPYGVWNDLELYGHEIIGCLNHFTNAIFDFNAFLNTKGGPFHNRETGGIPSIVVNEKENTFTPQPHYYAMAHFSRYILPGAKIIVASCSVNDAGIETAAAINTDGSVVCVILNTTDRNRKSALFVDQKKQTKDIMLPAHSLTTVIVE